jgi:transposase
MAGDLRDRGDVSVRGFSRFRLVARVSQLGLLRLQLTLVLRDLVSRRGCRCAQEVPPEFKRDVVRVARRGDLSQAEVAADFDISVESVRRWVRQADVDDGVVDGQTSAEQNELVQLRREQRRLEMENEILRRAAAYFAATVSQNELPAGS